MSRCRVMIAHMISAAVGLAPSPNSARSLSRKVIFSHSTASIGRRASLRVAPLKIFRGRYSWRQKDLTGGRFRWRTASDGTASDPRVRGQDDPKLSASRSGGAWAAPGCVHRRHRDAPQVRDRAARRRFKAAARKVGIKKCWRHCSTAPHSYNRCRQP